jgi:hypothetical protein
MARPDPMRAKAMAANSMRRRGLWHILALGNFFAHRREKINNFFVV